MLPDKLECGIDECGRGSLAGPVVAAAVIWPSDGVSGDHIIQDSKKLSPKKRKEIAAFIHAHAVEWSIAFVSANEVDDINILNATFRAMHSCIDQLSSSVDHILVDGNQFQQYRSIPYTCVVKGDDKYVSIAAASIIAKVAHDEWMCQVAKQHPEYAWDKNMGYGTCQHIQAIQRHGLTLYHRKTFCQKMQKPITNGTP